jgi:hypothetical protein
MRAFSTFGFTSFRVTWSAWPLTNSTVTIGSTTVTVMSTRPERSADSPYSASAFHREPSG